MPQNNLELPTYYSLHISVAEGYLSNTTNCWQMRQLWDLYLYLFLQHSAFHQAVAQETGRDIIKSQCIFVFALQQMGYLSNFSLGAGVQILLTDRLLSCVHTHRLYNTFFPNSTQFPHMFTQHNVFKTHTSHNDQHRKLTQNYTTCTSHRHNNVLVRSRPVSHPD